MAGLDNAWEQVLEFHRAFDVPVANRPAACLRNARQRAAAGCRTKYPNFWRLQRGMI